MKLLLIRHGQSADDLANISQRNDSPLSQLGEKQAEQTHKLMKRFQVNAVYASPYQRTQETAEILFPSLQTNTLDFIYEIRRPRNLDGGLHKDAVHFWEVDHKADKYKPDWTFDGSESFNDVITRAERLREFLYDTHTEEETIAIVSHGGFIRHFIGRVGMKDYYTPQVFFDLFFLMKIRNLDVIEVQLSEKQLTGWDFHPLPESI